MESVEGSREEQADDHYLGHDVCRETSVSVSNLDGVETVAKLLPALLTIFNSRECEERCAFFLLTILVIV